MKAHAGRIRKNASIGYGGVETAGAAPTDGAPSATPMTGTMSFRDFVAYAATNLPSTPLTFNPRELQELLEREAALTRDQSVMPGRWIPLSEAINMTGVPERTLRDRAARWARMAKRGERPPVRVRKEGDAERSPWLFDESDCRVYGQGRSGTGGGRRASRSGEAAARRPALKVIQGSREGVQEGGPADQIQATIDSYLAHAQ